MIFTRPPLQHGYNHSQRPPAPHAALGANLICVRAAEAFPRAWVKFIVPGPRHHSSCRGRLHAALRYSSCIPPALLPLHDKWPQPHAANWRLPPMRLELTMFMPSLSSRIPESLPHCSKAHCSHITHREGTAAAP
jgi:hypothetical protein